MPSPLQQEFEWYLAHQQELVAQYNGKFAMERWLARAGTGHADVDDVSSHKNRHLAEICTTPQIGSERDERHAEEDDGTDGAERRSEHRSVQPADVAERAAHGEAAATCQRCDEVAEVWGVRVDLDLPPPVPAVVNDAAATARWRAVTGRVLGADQVIEMPPATPSDDVSEFLRRVPGCFYFVGAAPGPHMPPVHHAPDFAIDEESLRVGMLTLAAAAVDFAEPDQTA